MPDQGSKVRDTALQRAVLRLWGRDVSWIACGVSSLRSCSSSKSAPELPVSDTSRKNSTAPVGRSRTAAVALGATMLLVLALTGCGGHAKTAAGTSVAGTTAATTPGHGKKHPHAKTTPAKTTPAKTTTQSSPAAPQSSYPKAFALGNDAVAHWAVVQQPVVAHKGPSLSSAAVTTLSTMTGDGTSNLVLVIGEVDKSPTETWYRVRLPILPNNSVGYVPSTWTLSKPLHRLHPPLCRSQGGDRDAEAERRDDLLDPRRRRRVQMADTARELLHPGRAHGLQRSLLRADRLQDERTLGRAHGSGSGGGFVGVHGTNEPNIIPGQVSHGCISDEELGDRAARSASCPSAPPSRSPDPGGPRPAGLGPEHRTSGPRAVPRRDSSYGGRAGDTRPKVEGNPAASAHTERHERCRNVRVEPGALQPAPLLGPDPTEPERPEQVVPPAAGRDLRRRARRRHLPWVRPPGSRPSGMRFATACSCRAPAGNFSSDDRDRQCNCHLSNAPARPMGRAWPAPHPSPHPDAAEAAV